MRLRAVVAALGVALAACTGPGAASSPTPAPATAIDRRLVAADQRLFSGDYEGAENDYRRLVASHVPDAGAHYALLLAYENRFQEAIEQARVAVDERPDSASLARLTRAYDWSLDVPAAVATGARAVAVQPVDPLAHVFYSEALADAGRFAEAEAQLRAAERAAPPDGYTRSEIYREWANYYRDRQETQSELNNIELSLKAQKDFPERRFELARHLYAASKADQARQALSDAAKDSRSAAVLAVAGDAALVAQDLDTAAGWYQASDRADPANAAAALPMAVIDVAGRRDFKAAHDRLVATLRRDPTRGDVYEFLWHLDRYLLKTDPHAELEALSPNGAQPLAAARKEALDALNGVRRLAGVQPAREDPALDAAAEAHVWYTLFNYGQASLTGLGVHLETSSLPAYVASTPIARDRAAGYPGTRGSEVVDHAFSPAAAVGVWEHSVYHRFPLISREAEAIGFGEAQVGVLTTAVMDIGLAAPGRSQPVVFPADGQKDVPPAFTGNEVPDPAPQGTVYPTGYPVTLEVGSASGAQLSGRLLGSDGKEVPSYPLEANRQVGSNEWGLLPKQPLRPGATYTVEVSGTIDGQPYSRRWAFTVAPGLA